MRFWNKNRYKEQKHQGEPPQDQESSYKRKPTMNSSLFKTHPSSTSIHNQAVELGTINYVNLTPDSKHGDYDIALEIAKETGKPIFANFVEWSG